MGEARRKPIFAGELFAIPCSNSCTRSIVYCVLTIIANTLDAQLFIKEPGDDLLEWPVNSFIGRRPISKLRAVAPALSTSREGRRQMTILNSWFIIYRSLPLIA
jgi:hypothetical protein